MITDRPVRSTAVFRQRAALTLVLAPLGAFAGHGAQAAGAVTDDGGVAAQPASGGFLGASPSVLPATGIGGPGPDVRLGTQGSAALANTFSGVPNAPGGMRAWTITPQIGLTGEYISGGNQAGGAGSQFITTLLPSVDITGASARLQADLFYAPTVSFYDPEGSQNRVAQNFNGRVLATLLPQTLFLDLRGSAALQTVAPGTTPVGTTTPTRGNLSQTTSFSASPYALQRFGPWGTGEIGGTVSHTAQNALEQAGTQIGAQQALTTAAAASNQDVTTYSGHLAFTTGEAFSFYSGAALAQLTSFEGTGVLADAYRNTATLDNGYAISRTVTVLAKFGYEDIRYGGTTPTRISDALWNAGIRLEPNAGSSITVRYGHQDGFDSLQLDAGVQPTARTRLYARYSTGLTTQAELLQNALATSDLDTQGNPVDHATGAPLVPVGTFFGTQNNLNKTTLASLTGTLLLDRDTFTLSINSEVQRLVSSANAVGLAQGNTNGVYGALSWTHQLWPNLQATLYGQLGTNTTSATSQSARSRQQTTVVSFSLAYELSPTVSMQLQYTYNKNFGGNQNFINSNVFRGNQNFEQNVILVRITKSF
jgi:uncharacterized protein (PEP-CTERM system associated)